MKKILILGAGGFIGSHLANRLSANGNKVCGVDIKSPLLPPTYADFRFIDLTESDGLFELVGERFDEVYQLAANMGGAGFVFTGNHDAEIMQNSARINLNVLAAFAGSDFAGKIFFSSSACVYRENPQDPSTPEHSAYPALPDSEYGWEKLFSERLYLAYARNHGLNVRIARYHNIFGPFGTFQGGREKAPAAICRKVAKAKDGDVIELWGDGSQLRSFLYIDECVEGTLRLMASDCPFPVNIGSDEMVSIEQLARMAIDVSEKDLGIVFAKGPLGVHGRNSDNTFLRLALGWAPKQPLRKGIELTYAWIDAMVGGEA